MNEEKDNNPTLAEALENAPLDVAGLPKTQDLVRLFIPQSIDKPLWRTLMSGYMKAPRTEPKVNRFWFEGRLLTREEHDKLSVEAIQASNDVINHGRRR